MLVHDACPWLTALSALFSEGQVHSWFRDDCGCDSSQWVPEGRGHIGFMWWGWPLHHSSACSAYTAAVERAKSEGEG